MKIVTAAQMRAIEDDIFESGRATAAQLMVRAGRAVAEAALALVAHPASTAALVLVGPGKNGGDGLVVAEALRAAGLRDVAVWLYRREGLAGAPVDAALLARVRVVEAGATFDEALAGAGLIVDALYGLGQRLPLPADLTPVLAAINARGQAVGVQLVALDAPTGVDADSGAASEEAFVADLTVTLGRPKRGLLLGAGLRATGRLAIATLEMTDDVVPDDAPRLIERDAALARLPRRRPDAHKGTAGSLLIVGGSGHYLGAPALAAGAALRAGAGLVTLAAPRGIVTALASAHPEVTYLPLPEAGWGVIGPAAVKVVTGALERYTALLVGNGLGREPETTTFLDRLFGTESAAQGRGRLGFGTVADEGATAGASIAAPVVLDADGLNWLSSVELWWERLRDRTLLLTPHPGEMGRLRGIETSAVTADPWGTARAAAREWGQTVLLKGGYSVVATPTGELWVSPLANPALAAAGTGDTLAGLIAGLLTQGLAPTDAAILGLYVGARAGELAQAALGTLPVIAGDLPAYVGRAIRELEEGRKAED